MESQPRLLDQMRDVLRLKHRSVRTEKAYIGWVKRFILFHDKRHPKDMGTAEIRAFLVYLATHEHVAASTQNGALNAPARQPQPRRLPVTSHPSWPCPAARACSLPAADRAGQPRAGRRDRLGGAGGLRSPGGAFPTGLWQNSV